MISAQNKVTSEHFGTFKKPDAILRHYTPLINNRCFSELGPVQVFSLFTTLNYDYN